jgi:3-oxoacyl-(acyl-carrier-protein) synthase
MSWWVQPPGDDVATVQELAAAVARAAGPLLDRGLPPDERGLYLATGDAGVAVSGGFWAAALAESPRFASPADFPWTLANAPAGLLARELAIRGPNYTLVGGADAMLAALEHAREDLGRGRIGEALVVGCDLAARPQAAALVLRATGVLPVVAPSGVAASRFLTGLCSGDGRCEFRED